VAAPTTGVKKDTIYVKCAYKARLQLLVKTQTTATAGGTPARAEIYIL